MTTILRPLRLTASIRLSPPIAAGCEPDRTVLQPTATAPSPPLRQSVRPLTFRKWYQSLWQPRAATAPPYQHITQIGDPLLRRRTAPVPAASLSAPEVRFLADRLVAVMRDYKCCGLAAPQIGIDLQMMCMQFTADQLAEFTPEVRKARQMQELPLTVLVNPRLEVRNFAQITHTESCESVRGYAADVARYAECTVHGFDASGQPVRLELSGWNARIAQHELDHLNGVLYTDVMRPETLACTCWQAVNSREGRVYIEFGPK